MKKDTAGREQDGEKYKVMYDEGEMNFDLTFSFLG